ncbi:MAG: lysoplasmalogenase [Nakamurella sp.]
MRTTLFRVTAALDVAAAAVGTPTARRVRSLTKAALMPVLGFSALRRTPGARSRRAGTAAAGLALSWCGDVALLRDDETAFVVGLGAFLGGHLAYGAGFGAAGGVDGLRSNPLLAVPALAVAGAGAAALLPVAGSLRGPVAGYIGVITAMTALAIGTRRPTAIAGAALFCASDLLLGLSRFRMLPLPKSVVHAVVMTTYSAAQELIVRSLLESPGNG